MEKSRKRNDLPGKQPDQKAGTMPAKNSHDLGSVLMKVWNADFSHTISLFLSNGSQVMLKGSQQDEAGRCILSKCLKLPQLSRDHAFVRDFIDAPIIDRVGAKLARIVIRCLYILYKFGRIARA